METIKKRRSDFHRICAFVLSLFTSGSQEPPEQYADGKTHNGDDYLLHMLMLLFADEPIVAWIHVFLKRGVYRIGFDSSFAPQRAFALPRRQ